MYIYIICSLNTSVPIESRLKTMAPKMCMQEREFWYKHAATSFDSAMATPQQKKVGFGEHLSPCASWYADKYIVTEIGGKKRNNGYSLRCITVCIAYLCSALSRNIHCPNYSIRAPKFADEFTRALV
jgi:hypothetical protein